jgi:hypothetical protein
VTRAKVAARWRARALSTRLVALVAIVLEILNPARRSGKAIVVSWPPPGARTFGDLFSLIALVDLLTISGFRVDFRLFEPTEFSSKFKQLSLETRRGLVLGWTEMLEIFLSTNPKVDLSFNSSESHASEEIGGRSLLESVITKKSNYVTAATTVLFRLLDRKRKEAFRDHYRKHQMPEAELTGLGLPRDFITCNVRQNHEYREHRNPSDSEIVSDLRMLCEQQPLPIVILTEAESRKRLRTLLKSNLAADFSAGRFLFAPTDSFVSVLRVIWSGRGHFQRRGGGAGMAAIFSPLPYVIVWVGPEEIGNFVLGAAGAPAPWSRRGSQRGVFQGGKAAKQLTQAVAKSVG